jgi:polyisoprenoid-binding protein YceI
MVKKILIIGGIVVVLAVVVLFAIPWGEYESNVDKSDLEETITYDATDTLASVPSLDELEGEYAASAGETAEILFHTDGLKKTKGGFEEFEISFDVQDDFKQSNLTVTIQTASLNTGNSLRDEHLVEEDFFDAKKFPTIIYTANQIALGDTSYIAKGEMTMNGTTNELEVPFLHLGSGGEKVTFEAFEGSFEFDRTNYGQEEESGVGNIVRVEFYCELVK